METKIKPDLFLSIEVAMNNNGLIIGIIAGLGLGLLLGSEFAGSTITIIGAIILVLALISMVLLSLRKRM